MSKSKIDFQLTGKRLRSLRGERKLTLEQVAIKAEVSINYISLLEKGYQRNPSDRVLCSLSKILLIDEQELFGLYGRISPSVMSELEGSETLVQMLYDIKNNRDLTDIDKKNLYEAMNKMYLKFKY